jgi:hypothetical protein
MSGRILVPSSAGKPEIRSTTIESARISRRRARTPAEIVAIGAVVHRH